MMNVFFLSFFLGRGFRGYLLFEMKLNEDR